MVMTAGPGQTDSPYHEAWVLKRIALVQTALIGPAQHWYSHLPLDIKKNWQAVCREFQKTIDNQQSQTQAKLEQMTRKAYVNIAPGMRIEQMNDALVKALDPQLARISLKNFANHEINRTGTTTPICTTGRKKTPRRYYKITY